MPQSSPLGALSEERIRDLQRTRFVNLAQVTKPAKPDIMPSSRPRVATEHTFVSRSEERYLNLPSSKNKKAAKVEKHVEDFIEEQLEETGKMGWMKRLRSISEPGHVVVGAKVAKDWSLREQVSRSKAPISGAERNSSLPAVRPWPSIHKSGRPKHVPIPSDVGAFRRPQDLVRSQTDTATQTQGAKEAVSNVEPRPIPRAPVGRSTVHPAERVGRHRPTLRNIVTTTSVPIARQNIGSPSTPDSPSLSRLHSRPTIRDLVRQEAALQASPPPLPSPSGPSVSRASSTGSDLASLLDVYASTQPEGNAFAPTGFWAARGLRTEPSVDELMRYERSINQNTGDTHTQRDSWESLDTMEKHKSASPKTEAISSNSGNTTVSVTSHEASENASSGTRKISWDSSTRGTSTSTNPRRTLFRSRTNTAPSEFAPHKLSSDLAARRNLFRSKTEMITSESSLKRSSNESQPKKMSTPFTAKDPFGSVSSKSSLESNQNIASFGIDFETTTEPLEDRPFSTGDFLAALGIHAGKPVSDDHQFSGFDNVPQNPALREAYNHVRDTLISYWFSNPEPKEDAPAMHPAASATSLVTQGPLQRPGLRSKPSRFRLFSKQSIMKSSDTESGNAPESEPESPTKISQLPSSLMSRKTKKEPYLSNLPVMDKTTAKAVEVTVIVLRQMQQEFGLIRYPSLTSYITHKPLQVYFEEEQFLRDEKVYRTKFKIEDMKQLKNKSAWLERKSPRDWVNPDYVNDPSEYDYETVYEKQREYLDMIRSLRKREMRIPSAGLRIVWATKFVEQAIEKHERAVEDFNKQLAQTTGPNAPHSAPGAKAESDSGSSQRSDDGLRYAKLLRDIEDESTQLVNQAGPSSPVLLSPKLVETEEEAKRRRRKTAFNMGLMHSEPQPPQIEMATQRVNALEKEKVEWEQSLKMGLAAEKKRQEEQRRMFEAERRAGAGTQSGGFQGSQTGEGEHSAWFHAMEQHENALATSENTYRFEDEPVEDEEEGDEEDASGEGGEGHHSTG